MQSIIIIEQVLSHDSFWEVPIITPGPIQDISLEKYINIQNKLCTNLDFSLQEFLINFYSNLNMKGDIQLFDIHLGNSLKERYGINFFSDEFSNHIILNLNQLKEAEFSWKRKFKTDIAPYIITGAIERGDFYIKNFYIDYRILICFKKQKEQMDFSKNMLNSSIEPAPLC